MRCIVALIGFCILLPAAAAQSEGERLAYVLGCVSCHHQTPKEIINAPPLVIVKTYSAGEFAHFLRSGNTNTGRKLYQMGSLMGEVAVEQFSFLTETEVQAVYQFLHNDWTPERAAVEETKIAGFRARMKATMAADE